MTSTRERAVRHHNNAGGLSKSSAVLVSMAYATILASLPLRAFQDRENYLAYAENSLLILARHAVEGPLTLLVNEPLWLLFNSGIASVLSPEETLRVIILVPAFMVAYRLLQAHPRQWIWLLVFLLLPQMMKNHVIHLRQGLAVAVFLWAWFSERRWVRLGLMSVTPFLHASFFLVLSIYGVSRVMTRMRFAADLHGISYILGSLVAGLSVGVLASSLGARQAAEYEFGMGDISGLGFVFWFFITVLYITQGKRFISNHAFAFGGVVFYLVTYPLIEVAARFFESMIPFVLLAGLGLSKWRRNVFIFSICLYGGAQWVVGILRDGGVF